MFCNCKDKIEKLEKQFYTADESSSRNLRSINWLLYELRHEVSNLHAKVNDKPEPVITATSSPNVMTFSISPKVIDKLKTISFLVSAYPYYSNTGESARERAIELLNELIKDLEGK